jgi:exopolysaccharide production protein ExoQ
MADSAIVVGGARSSSASQDWLADLGLLAFLLMIFVGLSPFAIRDPATLALGESGFAASGDAMRQIAYMSAFALVVLAAFRKQGFHAFDGISLSILALLAWCILSASWAAEPAVCFRRAVLASVIALSAMLSVTTLGAPRSLALLKLVLACVLVVNWVSIPLVPQAIHLPGETDPGLVGDWRGLYFHKNIAGSITAMTAILFFFSFVGTRQISDLVVFVAATLFMVMTHSKSSIGLLPIAAAAGLVYRAIWRRGIDRVILGVGLLLLAIFAVTFAVMDWDAIARIFADPEEFTGRSAIWQGEIAFIRDHPFLGSGFGSFSDTGTLSPLHNYVGEAWVRNTSHGHNAYLQLLVTIGGIGFALACYALIVVPLRGFIRLGASHIEIGSLLFAIFVFMVLHNLLESDFLEGDDGPWVAFLMMLVMLSRAANGRTNSTSIPVPP